MRDNDFRKRQTLKNPLDPLAFSSYVSPFDAEGDGKVLCKSAAVAQP